ncbi:MAG: exo-alpha-sialidase [Phycisphaerae bacterium]|nr:exo-alpha-sialidase [Phycisphaerae bacterium]
MDNVSVIQRETSAAWRVDPLTVENAGTGLMRHFTCLFTIPNYWPYGYVSSRELCSLPGKALRVSATGQPGETHHFFSPALNEQVNRYRILDGKLFVAWQFRVSDGGNSDSQYSYVRPDPGPWELWLSPVNPGRWAWTIRLKQDGGWIEENIDQPSGAGEIDVQLILSARELIVQVNGQQQGRFTHDAYEDAVSLQFGCGRRAPTESPAVTTYRDLYVHTQPYPYPGVEYPDGPEDIQPEDDAIVGYVHQATPQAPRASEGDILPLADGRLLAVYSLYDSGTGWDESPARLAGRISADGGRSWSEPAMLIRPEEGSQGNVMSVSLLRGLRQTPGDLMLACFDKTPRMKAKGMVLRRSHDEGNTWGPRVEITPPDSENVHVANNACLTRLSTGRIVLATREYVEGIRWPYACYSDDDGRTWIAGKHVPDAGLLEEQKKTQNLNEPSICELADGRLLMTMRTTAGGQFFAWSSDRGETWGTPVRSALAGVCGPAIVRRVPDSDDILTIWAYGLGGRTPLCSAISSDGGVTWRHLKRLEQSPFHSYGYVSCTFVQDRVLLSYMHTPEVRTVFRFEADPNYTDLRFVSLPSAWLYRNI